MSRQIMVGNVPVGGNAPVSIQSMCNTRTSDFEATSAQIRALADAGCQIVRVAVPDMEAARAIPALKRASAVPLVADIHFDWRLALEAVRGGINKVRNNPGNIGDADRVRRWRTPAARRTFPFASASTALLDATAGEIRRYGAGAVRKRAAQISSSSSAAALRRLRLAQEQ